MSPRKQSGRATTSKSDSGVAAAGENRLRRPVVVALDPGGRYSGLVVRQGDALHAHSLIKRTGDDIVAYVNIVTDTINEVMLSLPMGYAALAVEGVQPYPHLQANPQGLYNTCYVVGAVMSEWPDVLVIQPARHGAKRPLREHYPDDLIGASEVVGSGMLNHCRAAWDQAAAAALLLDEMREEAA